MVIKECLRQPKTFTRQNPFEIVLPNARCNKLKTHANAVLFTIAAHQLNLPLSLPTVQPSHLTPPPLGPTRRTADRPPSACPRLGWWSTP